MAQGEDWLAEDETPQDKKKRRAAQDADLLDQRGEAERSWSRGIRGSTVTVVFAIILMVLVMFMVFGTNIKPVSMTNGVQAETLIVVGLAVVASLFAITAVIFSVKEQRQEKTKAKRA